MPYIVKSSLDIGGKIVPWNEQETEKLIKEKKEYFQKEEKVQEVKVEETIEETIEKEVEVKEEKVQETKKDDFKMFKSSKKNQKAGEK